MRELAQRAAEEGIGRFTAEILAENRPMLTRAAARGEFIGLPVVLRGWMDLSEKIIATLLVPVGAFCDTSGNLPVTGRGSRAAPGRARKLGSFVPCGRPGETVACAA